MGALFLRLQLTLPDRKAAAGTEEDKEASLALQTLLGENTLEGGGDKGDTGGAAASSGAATGGSAGVSVGGAGKETARDAAAGAGGGGAVARLLGMPMGFRNTIRDVQDTIGTVLDTVEVSERHRGCCCYCCRYCCCCCCCCLDAEKLSDLCPVPSGVGARPIDAEAPLDQWFV